MTRASTVTQAQIARAVGALRAAGIGISHIEISPGLVRVIPGAPAALTAALAPEQPDDLDGWRRKRAKRAPQGS
jgi:hypothetical protein